MVCSHIWIQMNWQHLASRLSVVLGVCCVEHIISILSSNWTVYWCICHHTHQQWLWFFLHVIIFLYPGNLLKTYFTDILQPAFEFMLWFLAGINMIVIGPGPCCHFTASGDTAIKLNLSQLSCSIMGRSHTWIEKAWARNSYHALSVRVGFAAVYPLQSTTDSKLVQLQQQVEKGSTLFRYVQCIIFT